MMIKYLTDTLTLNRSGFGCLDVGQLLSRVNLCHNYLHTHTHTPTHSHTHTHLHTPHTYTHTQSLARCCHLLAITRSLNTMSSVSQRRKYTYETYPLRWRSPNRSLSHIALSKRFLCCLSFRVSVSPLPLLVWYTFMTLLACEHCWLSCDIIWLYQL